jgi:hypothetical protein
MIGNIASKVKLKKRKTKNKKGTKVEHKLFKIAEGVPYMETCLETGKKRLQVL